MSDMNMEPAPGGMGMAQPQQQHYAGQQMEPNAMGASYNQMVPMDGMAMVPGQQQMDSNQMAVMGMGGQVGYMNQQEIGYEDEQNYMAAGTAMGPGVEAVDQSGLITEQPSADPGSTRKKGGKLTKEEKKQKKANKKKKSDTEDGPIPDHEATNVLAHNWHVRHGRLDLLSLPFGVC